MEYTNPTEAYHVGTYHRGKAVKELRMFYESNDNAHLAQANLHLKEMEAIRGENTDSGIDHLTAAIDMLVEARFSIALKLYDNALAHLEDVYRLIPSIDEGRQQEILEETDFWHALIASLQYTEDAPALRESALKHDTLELKQKALLKWLRHLTPALHPLAMRHLMPLI